MQMMPVDYNSGEGPLYTNAGNVLLCVCAVRHYMCVTLFLNNYYKYEFKSRDEDEDNAAAMPHIVCLGALFKLKGKF